MILRVTNVDLYGYNGRDNHPSKTDEGKLVAVIGMLSETTDGETDVDEVAKVAARLVVDFAMKEEPEDAPGVVLCFQCVDREGNRLDLMEHEVELVKS